MFYKDFQTFIFMTAYKNNLRTSIIKMREECSFWILHYLLSQVISTVFIKDPCRDKSKKRRSVKSLYLVKTPLLHYVVTRAFYYIFIF